MNLSLLLAKVFGIFFFVLGLALIFKRKTIREALEEVMHNEALIFGAGVLNLILGLFLVFSHNVWQDAWRIVITLISWIILLKGLFMIFFPQLHIKTAKLMRKKEWVYSLGGVVMLILGMYFIYQGLL